MTTGEKEEYTITDLTTYQKEHLAEFIRKHLVELNKLMIHLNVPVMIQPHFVNEKDDVDIYRKHFIF